MLIGSVDNGEKVDVTVGDWTGRGAIRRERGRVELVYIGPAPDVLPCTITVAGAPQLALSKARNRDSAPFTILTLDTVPPHPAAE